MIPLLRLTCLLALTAAPLAGLAQLQLPVHSSPVASSSPDSRLRQTETIYQLQLRNRHVPLLSKYITDLQKLAAQSSDPQPFQREIERMQQVLGNGGVVDLAAAIRSLKSPAEMPPPQPSPSPARPSRDLIALTPALARNIRPLPSGSASPDAAGIGEIDWRIETLSAGTYDVVLNYACPEPGSSLPIRLEIADARLDYPLDASKATSTATSFQLLRLGQLILPTEVKGGTLRLQAGTPEQTLLRIRQLILTRKP